MQMTIPTPTPAPDLARLEAALTEADPSAVLDMHEAPGTLRVSTLLDPVDVARVLASAGLHVSADAIERVPSDCCGGCGG